MKLAKDRLLLYGLSEADINHSKDETALQKARWVVRAPGDGMVVERNVVPGNYYKSTNTLLTVAKIDRLKVVVRLSPTDAEKVKIGDSLSIRGPVGDQVISATIESLDWDAARGTGETILRTTIPNTDSRWKAGMLVRLTVPRRTNLPANAAASTPEPVEPARGLEQRVHRLEQLLEKHIAAGRSDVTNENVITRLNEIERKLDRLLNARSGQ